MYNIQVHNRIIQFVSLFTFIGLLHTDDRSNFRWWIFKSVNLCAAVYIPISMLVGSFLTDDKTEAIFARVATGLTSVVALRLFYFLSKKDEILKFVRTLGVFSIGDLKEFKQVNTKINGLMKFSVIYHSMTFNAIIVWVIVSMPAVSLGKEFPLNVYFPMNYKESVTARWIAIGFVAFNSTLVSIYTLINTIVWYLMMCCALKYQILGSEFRNLWVTTDAKKEARKFLALSSADEIEDVFLVELIALIKSYQRLRETTIQVTSCFSNLFFMQLATSGVLICGSVYALAFQNSMANPLVYIINIFIMLYLFFDTFMITYFGNEIKFWSSNLSYCLFECNWMDKSKCSKQCMIIMVELLKRPQVLLIGKLYHLDLEIFSNILNFAYSMFNFLKNFN